jgi:hypothetical protein
MVSPPAPTTALSLGNGPFPLNNPLLFVIPSVPGFPASLLSPATTDVVLSKENHTQLTEAATLDRKSGEGEGSAVRHSCAPLLPAHNRRQSSPILMETPTSPFSFRVSKSGPRNRRSLGFARDDKERVAVHKERLLNRGILKSNLDNSY